VKATVYYKSNIDWYYTAVNKWRNRFIQNSLDGLIYAPRSGKPSVFTAVQKARVIKPATQKPPKECNGTVALVAALSVHKGDITAMIAQSNNAENFPGFLKTLYRKCPGKYLHIIDDNPIDVN